jgi:hypothetical protein
MFFIPKKGNGIRPVFNLKALNQYVTAPHFKMETITEISKLITPNSYLVSIDVQDAFLHIPVHPNHRKYFRFSWRNHTYHFKTTPFGLSVVPWLFTKICRPILEWARHQGIILTAYLDDWLLISNSREEARRQLQLILDKLQSLGWILNTKKSHLDPTQQLEHLGFRLDTTTMTAQLPRQKMRDILKSIRQILRHPLQTPRVISSICMRLQAAMFAILPARIYTRHLLWFKNQFVRKSHDWDIPRLLPPECLKELNWWLVNLPKWNGRSFLAQTPSATLLVDASDLGWGCHFQNQCLHGYWNHQEQQMSINWRELKAAFLALKCFPQLKNTTVLIRTDNMTSLSHINKHGGTRSYHLMTLATSLWKWCLRRNLNLQAVHIPGVDNRVADQESRRSFTKNHWQILPEVFQQL